MDAPLRLPEEPSRSVPISSSSGPRIRSLGVSVTADPCVRTAPLRADSKDSPLSGVAVAYRDLQGHSSRGVALVV